MLSWQLWQALSEPSFRNPIFHRVRSEQHKRWQPRQQLVIPRYLYYTVLIFIVIAIIRIPQLFVILLQLLALLITLSIVSPLMLPIVVVIMGGYLVSKIISDINQEKRQYTYELLCSSPRGTFHACWLYATGILYRGVWFSWHKPIVHLTYRITQIILIVLSCLMLLSIMSGDESTHFESLRTLVNISLVLGLFYSSMFQPLVLSLLIGIYGASFDLNERDSNIIALLIYVVLQFVPYFIAFALFIVFNTTGRNLHPAVVIGVDCIVLGSVYVVRELSIVMMWSRITRRLNSSSGETPLSQQVASIHI